MQRLNISQLMISLRDFEQLSLQEKGILLDIILYGQGTGESFPSMETLAKNANISLRYVQTLVKSLREKGFITVLKRGYGKSNGYSLGSNVVDLVSKHMNNSSYQKSTMDRNYPGSIVQGNNKLNIKRINTNNSSLCGRDDCENGTIFKIVDGQGVAVPCPDCEKLDCNS